MARRSGGGMKGVVVSIISFVLIGGLLFAVLKANGISDPGEIWDSAKVKSQEVRDCYEKTDFKPWECLRRSGGDSGGGGHTSDHPFEGRKKGGSGGKSGPGDSAPVKSPSEALAALEGLRQESPNKNASYDRRDWKHWTGSRCSNTREKVLESSGKKIKKDADGCKIVAGVWDDPYSGESIDVPRKVDIDHVIPLSYAAKHGADSWSAKKKEQFANDTSHLLAVSAKENRSKGDSGPGDWLVPNNEGFACEYSTIFVNTAQKYGVSISRKDYRALKGALRSCK